MGQCQFGSACIDGKDTSRPNKSRGLFVPPPSPSPSPSPSPTPQSDEDLAKCKVSEQTSPKTVVVPDDKFMKEKKVNDDNHEIRQQQKLQIPTLSSSETKVIKPTATPQDDDSEYVMVEAPKDVKEEVPVPVPVPVEESVSSGTTTSTLHPWAASDEVSSKLKFCVPNLKPMLFMVPSVPAAPAPTFASDGKGNESTTRSCTTSTETLIDRQAADEMIKFDESMIKLSYAFW